MRDSLNGAGDKVLKSSKRTEHKDQLVGETVEAKDLSNILFTRLIAKGKSFSKVDFKYTIFDACYLRNCRFDSCDFTGCRFVATNLHGSVFHNCKFDYATFERTNIDPDVLETNCPGPENLKMRFARSLRTNYQQMGDAQAVNRAIKVELQASELHLHKAWQSPESYYRSKYTGLSRAEMFVEWCAFKVLDFIWGNGENVFKLVRFALLIIFAIALVDWLALNDPTRAPSARDSFITAPQVFFGVLSPPWYPGLYLSLIVLVRLVVVGFFLSIIIKRFGRR